MRKFLLIFTSVLSSLYLTAQHSEQQVETPITYDQFLQLIIDNNVEYAAEKLNIDIANANIRTARMLPDPELTIEGTDNNERKMQMGYEVEAALDWTLELGRKRKARVELAKSESKLATSLLEDFYRNLRANATLQFLSALHNENLYHTQLEAYSNMHNIATADSLRYLFGEISEVTARQSKLEARTLLNEVMDAETEWRNSLLDLDKYINKSISDTMLVAQGDFNNFNRDFLLQELIIAAQNNRSDFIAAQQNKDVAKRLIALEKANRKIDLGLSLTVAHATYAHNEVAPTPAHTPVSFGVTIPLPFSNRKNSDLKVARFQHQQATYMYEQIEKEIAIEVAQAYRHYNTMRKQLQQFDDGILEEARIILEGRTYSYNRGESSLLEVLDAQRTYNEIRENYYETLYNTAAALVELESAAGIWDINF